MIFSHISPAEFARVRQNLLRFASIQLPYESDLAEDLVQEALLSAYKAADSFKGEAQLATWLTGILKNKLIDYFRHQKVQRAVFVSPQEQNLDACFEASFDETGHWTPEGSPQPWQNPEQSLNTKEFYDILQLCLYALPENTARVFMMSEILGLSAEEIRSQCAITQANFYTIMHRAREGLRQCLQIKWFNPQS